MAFDAGGWNAFQRARCLHALKHAPPLATELHSMPEIGEDHSTRLACVSHARGYNDAIEIMILNDNAEFLDSTYLDFNTRNLRFLTKHVQPLAITGLRLQAFYDLQIIGIEAKRMKEITASRCMNNFWINDLSRSVLHRILHLHGYF